MGLVRTSLSPLTGKNVAVLVSGGVDSCVASMMVRKCTDRVLGVFMQNWEDEEQDDRCRSMIEQDRADARFVCERLGIEFREVNYVRQYWNEVFSTFMADYEQGLTPNPDILCNERIKFGAFLSYATDKLGCDVIATGHYAGTNNGPLFEHPQPRAARLFRARDQVKDQTFFLSQLSSTSLRRVIFPLEHLLKTEVQRIAKEAGFDRITARKSSKGICFVGKRNYQSFIDKFMTPRPGHFIDVDTGQVVGEHSGFHYWTIGQHARIQNNRYRTRYYVARKSDPKENVIYVVDNANHPLLFSKTFVTMKPHWINQEPEQLSLKGQIDCMYKFQQKDSLSPCTIEKVNDEELTVRLHSKQRALTPGQYAVFYQNDECIGNARIKIVSN